MKVTLEIPESLAEHYVMEADEKDQHLETVLLQRLKVALPLAPTERYVLVVDRSRQQLEEILGGLPVLTPEDLVLRVRRLARIGMGDHELALTPGQMEEIAWRANKQGKTVERMVKETWDTFAADFFQLLK